MNPTGERTNFYFLAPANSGVAVEKMYRIPTLTPGTGLRFEASTSLGEHGGSIISFVPLRVRRVVFNNSTVMSDVTSAAQGAATHNFRGACSFPGAEIGYISDLSGFCAFSSNELIVRKS